MPSERDWRRWAATNLMRGVSAETLAVAAQGRGAPASLDRGAIELLGVAPEIEAGRALANRVEKLEGLLRALDALMFAEFDDVPVESNIEPDRFFDQYYRRNRPVVLADFGAQSEAVRSWNFDVLRERLGRCQVEVMGNRDADPDYEVRMDVHRREMAFDDFLRRIQDAGSSNDTYLVANNHLLDRPEAASLWQDLPTGEGILEPNRARGATFLWIGPAGTVTPLHHDKANVLLMQIMGQKKIRLIPSTQAPLLYNQRGVFSEVDLNAPNLERFPRFDDVRISELTISPGEALFTPAGWWHHVTSLTPSISVSFASFRLRNEFSWTQR